MFWNSPPNVKQRVCVITHAFGRPVVPESPHQSPSVPISYPHVRVITHARGTTVAPAGRAEPRLCGAPLATAAAPSHRLCRHCTDVPLPRLPVVTVSSADVGRAGEDRCERRRRRQKADQIGLVRQRPSGRQTCVGGGAGACGGAH